MSGTSMPLAPKANKKLVFLGVALSCAVGALPFLSKRVRQKEHEIADMRDSQYEQLDAKSAARNQRLSLGSHRLE